MSYLRVKHTVAVNAVRVDQRRAVLAEVVENLDDVAARQNLLQVACQSVAEGVHLHQIKHIAVILEAQLDQCYGLSLDETLAVEAEHRRRVACEDLATKRLNALRRLD